MVKTKITSRFGTRRLHRVGLCLDGKGMCVRLGGFHVSYARTFFDNILLNMGRCERKKKMNQLARTITPEKLFTRVTSIKQGDWFYYDKNNIQLRWMGVLHPRILQSTIHISLYLLTRYIIQSCYNCYHLISKAHNISFDSIYFFLSILGMSTQFEKNVCRITDTLHRDVYKSMMYTQKARCKECLRDSTLMLW